MRFVEPSWDDEEAILAPAPNRAECTGKAGATWVRPARTLSASAQIAFARAIHADRHGRARPRFLRSCVKRRLSLAAAACGTRTSFQTGGQQAGGSLNKGHLSVAQEVTRLSATRPAGVRRSENRRGSFTIRLRTPSRRRRIHALARRGREG